MNAYFFGGKGVVALAMCDRPDNIDELEFWQEQIELIKTKGLITYRTQGNELRIWEGSDFNVDLAIRDAIEVDRSMLASLLQRLRPLKPLVAQRHYANTGSLRYFERQYVDHSTKLLEIRCLAIVMMD